MELFSNEIRLIRNSECVIRNCWNCAGIAHKGEKMERFIVATEKQWWVILAVLGIGVLVAIVSEIFSRKNFAGKYLKFIPVLFCCNKFKGELNEYFYQRNENAAHNQGIYCT